ncbi:MAG: T9SS type A sorting domain-containing protein, partial [Chitinophagales bacterium]
YLKQYRQMPWNQFKNYQEQELSDNVLMQLVNNYNTIINTSHSYTAYEKYSQVEIIEPTLPISINFEPFSTTFASYSNEGIPAGTPGYDADSLTAVFKYILNPAGDVIRHNDTLYYEQQFYNYFAYDDGTAEKAYALNGIGSKLAIEFFANEPDTLKEVYIHWAYVDGGVPDLFFSLLIWDYIDTTLTSNGENIIYEADFLSPRYVDSINGWYVYPLTDFLGAPAPIVVDGYFYVGWLQTQSAFLNVGFDMNNVANEQVYYNIGGNWQQSELAGAIMIRPQVGGNYSMYTDVSDNAMENSLVIAPNPVHDNLIIHSILPQGSIGRIHNLSGQKMQSFSADTHIIDVSDLAPGFYILEVAAPDTGNLRITKFIKQ